MLTIKTFSRITAIPETTLRFYDEQGVLRPKGRAENGYRLYEADQILEAKFLYSLRLASIPLGKVRAYQQGAAQESLERWHRELGERIAWLTLARRYIDGLIQGRKDPVNLQVNPAERVVWFTHEAPTGGFGEFFINGYRVLQSAGFSLGPEYFRYVAYAAPGLIRGQVGFQLTDRTQRMPLPEGGEVEDRPETLTLSLAHRDDIARIPETYIRLQEFMTEHGWEPVGPPMERYPVGPPEIYVEVLYPIMYVGR